MAFVILARSGSLVYLFTEVVGGATYLAASWLGMHYFGLAGLGMAHLVTYTVYLTVVWAILAKEIGFRLSAENKLWVLLSLMAALAIHFLPSLGLAASQLPVALLIVAVAGVGSLYAIWLEMGEQYRVRAE